MHCQVSLTSTLGTTSRWGIFALSSIRLFQSSRSMVLEPQKNEDMISRALLAVDNTGMQLKLIQW